MQSWSANLLTQHHLDFRNTSTIFIANADAICAKNSVEAFTTPAVNSGKLLLNPEAGDSASLYVRSRIYVRRVIRKRRARADFIQEAPPQHALDIQVQSRAR